ncbi:Nphp3 [Symbiodinium natans]|uniref:Nphp3 protein n=1 Tax=Symbiodinium natans TaxID=878477 RepID=A0A812N8A7_9DINO|nr:Nphp3 [Symbiodinium natans]
MADVQTKAAAFIAVTVQRACHNSFIEWAKGDSPHAKYTVSSVIFVAQIICVVIGWTLAHSTGGKEDLKKCFDVGNLTKFFHIGLIYALGDIFEMESVNYIDSSTYTVLSQSKLIITATLMWLLDGSAQSVMQWFILFTTSSGMLEYVLVGKAKGGAMTFSVFGVCLALVKVMISCYVAVLNTKALKRDSNPFPVQRLGCALCRRCCGPHADFTFHPITSVHMRPLSVPFCPFHFSERAESTYLRFSCLKVSWAMASLVYMVVKDLRELFLAAVNSLSSVPAKDGILGDGMFGEWTHRTVVLVFCGFILKTLFNQYLLKVLDAIWKNISEAIGVILVYFGRVMFLGGKYDPTVFNAGVTVVLACIAYVLSKDLQRRSVRGVAPARVFADAMQRVMFFTVRGVLGLSGADPGCVVGGCMVASKEPFRFSVFSSLLVASLLVQFSEYWVKCSVLKRGLSCVAVQKFLDPTGNRIACRSDRGDGKLCVSREQVKDIVETLTDFCFSRDQQPEETYIWICCLGPVAGLCINQHRVKEAQESGDVVPFEDFEQAFGQRVSGIGHIIAMMAPWHEPLYISRIWCDFEMFTAKHVAESQVTIVMPPREAEDLRQELVNGQGVKAVWNVLSRLDVEKAQASVSRDRELILQLIHDGPGAHKLNTVIAEHLKDWILEACEGHLLRALQEDQVSPAIANLCNEVGGLLADLGYLERARFLLEEGLRLYENAGTLGTSPGADLLANLGEIHEKQGDLDVAAEIYERAALCFAAASAPEPLDYAALKRRQGRLLGVRGDLEGKLRLYEEARRICELADALESTEGTVLLSSIGAAKRQAGDMEAAVQAYEEALRIHERLQTLDSPEGATLLSNIGVARLRQRKKKAAKQAFERALSIREKTGTVETSAGATLLTNIADVQELFGDTEGELRLYLKAKDIREKTGTLDSSAGAVVLSHIGGIYAKQGDPTEALSWYARAREAREKSETLETDAGAKLLLKAAELLGQGDRRGEAAALLEEAWGIRTRSETLHSESGLKLLSSLCNLRAEMEECDVAEEVWEAARAVAEAMGDGSKMPGVRLMSALLKPSGAVATMPELAQRSDAPLGRLCNSDPVRWFSVWGSEVVPRVSVAGGVIGLILVNSTMPQVVRTSDGLMPQISRAMWIRMCLRITPLAGGLKAAQYAVMREMKLTLDQVCHPAVSTMLAFGVIGTGFQSVIYNSLISEMYKIYTGKEKAAVTMRELVRGIRPGIVWCFGRESVAMGAGLYLGPVVKEKLGASLRDEKGDHRIAGVHLSEGMMRFGSGFLSGACTAFGTQWMHNTSLFAGRLAATNEPRGAPYYTTEAWRTAYKELGPSVFYMNYPHRMCLIAGAVALLNFVDIFHRRELRMLLELRGDLRRRRGDAKGSFEAWAEAAALRAALGKVTGAPAADLYIRLASVCEELGDVALSEDYQEPQQHPVIVDVGNAHFTLVSGWERLRGSLGPFALRTAWRSASALDDALRRQLADGEGWECLSLIVKACAAFEAVQPARFKKELGTFLPLAEAVQAGRRRLPELEVPEELAALCATGSSGVPSKTSLSQEVEGSLAMEEKGQTKQMQIHIASRLCAMPTYLAHAGSEAECALYARNCYGCFDLGCRYCQVSPQSWNFGSGGSPAALDYVCLSRHYQCIDVLQLRPDVKSVESVAVTGCHALEPPRAMTTRPPTTTTETEAPDLGILSSSGSQAPWWPDEWSVVIWLAIILVSGFLLGFCCFLGRRCRRRLQRVHVAPQSALDSRMFKSKVGSVQWDFAKAGVVNVSDLEAAKRALAAALRSEASSEALPSRGRCLTFWASNCLRVAVLSELDVLLATYPILTISFDADWRRADNSTIEALAKLLLRHRGRCKFRTGGSQPLALPAATLVTLGTFGEALAASHSEVDSISFEKGPKDEGICSTSLAGLRLSSQEVIFHRSPLGDPGCSLVCGFVRSWGARLQICRLVECGFGDLAAAGVARLLANARQPASGLRELNLSANKFGDGGAAELADALPRLDSLEKLLLERNKIGALGAKALAARLPRSNVRELVMGTHLGGNPLGEEGVQALASALDDAMPRAAANRATRLQALALEDCGVGQAGAKALAEQIPKSVLQALSVARGHLADEDATALLLALPGSISFLDLSGNELSDLTASIAGEALYKKPKLSISLAANYISPTIKLLLAEEHGTRLRV